MHRFRWHLCAFAAGAITSLLFANRTANSPLYDPNIVGAAAAQMMRYVPLLHAVVISVFVYTIIQRKFAGIWSVVLSYFVGGMSASLLLLLWRQQG
jgi:hypothetical protein